MTLSISMGSNDIKILLFYARTATRFVFILILFASTNVLSQAPMEFADYLMQDNDYFRAISEYKKILYYSNDNEIQNICLLKISKAYLKSAKFKAAIRFSSRLLNRIDISDDQHSRAHTYIGLSYYGLKVFPMAEDHFLQASETDTTGFPSLYLALIDTERGFWDKASDKYRNIYQKYPNAKIASLSEELSTLVLNGKDIKHKSPYAACLLSAFIPGGGQIYCNHYYDGIQALLYVGAFSYASYMAYKYDHNLGNNYIHTYIALSITSLFYGGNLIGAYRTAAYYNFKQENVFKNQIREKIFDFDY